MTLVSVKDRKAAEAKNRTQVSLALGRYGILKGQSSNKGTSIDN